ncbi:MarR family winged helix-turn-helix transcriptional regulator [Microlunatus parietis]|uniref:DNA-binding MarR family transcriptional regulator n=1 Tax=Microlunatus parietis TaxID=682979 RepID=A0A7Y9ICY6_9ACTN|nr:MarR family transcriptional regulator [Microlunatus parietis]NYE74014.1 DNA-binding MarR family transcriptional regulator [Microlunatus parietis]
MVKQIEPDHIFALLGGLLDALRSDFQQEAKALRQPYRRLRTSQLRLLSLTPAEGMRLTDLAVRVGMTKQALGEFANVLENDGFLESVSDPTDRRVRILRPTAKGRRAVEAGNQVISAVEKRWRERLGAEHWDRLRALLADALP